MSFIGLVHVHPSTWLQFLKGLHLTKRVLKSYMILKIYIYAPLQIPAYAHLMMLIRQKKKCYDVWCFLVSHFITKAEKKFLWLDKDNIKSNTIKSKVTSSEHAVFLRQKDKYRTSLSCFKTSISITILFNSVGIY